MAASDHRSYSFKSNIRDHQQLQRCVVTSNLVHRALVQQSIPYSRNRQACKRLWRSSYRSGEVCCCVKPVLSSEQDPDTPFRPGAGGSTPVALNIRMKVWLETVPALLRKTNVKHVSLITHSAGGVYTFNTLAELRSILDPKAPFVGLLAPWVPVAHSSATLMNFASKLPANVIDYLSPLQGFIVSKIAPTVSFSGGFLSSTAALVGGPKNTNSPGPVQAGSPEDAAEKYGVDLETAKIMRSLAVKFNLAEDTTGANEEAKLCLMKGGKADWGALADYEACVQSIADRERERVQAGEVKLRMEAAFASSDVIIGKGSQEYFEKCWRREGISDGVDFMSRTCEGVDHDGVLVDFHKGALKGLFESVAKRLVV
jgi:hypothetical protein